MDRGALIISVLCLLLTPHTVSLLEVEFIIYCILFLIFIVCIVGSTVSWRHLSFRGSRGSLQAARPATLMAAATTQLHSCEGMASVPNIKLPGQVIPISSYRSVCPRPMVTVIPRAAPCLPPHPHPPPPTHPHPPTPTHPPPPTHPFARQQAL